MTTFEDASVPFLIEPTAAEFDQLIAEIVTGTTSHQTSLMSAVESSEAAAVLLGVPAKDGGGAGHVRGLSALSLAGVLLARTSFARFFVYPDPQLHPINVARTASTLASLHSKRLGIVVDTGFGATDSQDARLPWYLPQSQGAERTQSEAATSTTAAERLLESLAALWESWPLDSSIGVLPDGRYVDDAVLGRVTTADLPHIGGPLTLPTDTVDKPVLGWDGPAAPTAAEIGLQAEGFARVSVREAAERRKNCPLRHRTLREALNLPHSPTGVGNWVPAYPQQEGGDPLQASR